jgi:hypothetical protein
MSASAGLLLGLVFLVLLVDAEKGSGPRPKPFSPNGLDLAGGQKVFLLDPSRRIEAQDIVDKICEDLCPVGAAVEVRMAVVGGVKEAINRVKRHVPWEDQLGCPAHCSDCQLKLVHVRHLSHIISDAD